MKTFSLPPLLFAIFLLASTLGLQAAITVNGIADEDIDTDSATFDVPSEAGFTIVATLNDDPMALDTSIVVTTPGYYELDVTKTNNTDTTEELLTIQFIVLDSNRGTSERGLFNWVPYPTIDSSSAAFGGANLEVITPSALPQGFKIPFIARVSDSTTGDGLRLNGTVKIPEAPGNDVRILRGFGSWLLPAPAASGPANLTPALHALTNPQVVQIEAATTWTTVSSDILATTDWGTNARIHITADLTIGDGVTVTVGAGSVIQLNPGVDIELDGNLVINGTTTDPTYFTNTPGQNPWGGFLLRGANSEVTATGAIFTGSGADDDWFSGSGFSSHRKEQATFLFDTNTNGSFTDCFFIDLLGQALHGKDATVGLTDCLVQRIPTVGQFNGGAVTVTRGALIEADRNDNNFYDNDNDVIYFTAGSHQLLDTVIGWAKDDGVDAGSGSSGSVIVTNSWFEACFHEGMAWSGEGRSITVTNSVAMNCGQGIEAGWSGSASANSPIVGVTGSLCIGNHIGLRFGDNYDWDYDGQLNVSNSLSLYNDRDVWGYEWDSWNYRSDKMNIQNNKLSEADPRHPANTVWDGASDSALLIPLSPAPGTAAGCGFGEWTLQEQFATYGEDVTLSLSEFSTVPVSIDYEIASDTTTVATGTIQFAPGELRKSISVPSLGSPPMEYVRVTLTGATGGEITTPRNLFYVATPGTSTPQVLIPKGAAWRYLDDGSNQGTAWQGLGFTDTGWPLGNAELGYGDGQVTLIEKDDINGNRIATTYFRHTFNVPDPSLFSTLDIKLQRDDGAIVYLNGEEEFRSHIDDGPLAYDTFTGNVTADGDETTFFEKSIPASKLQTGTNLIAVEVHQANDTSSDVSFDLELVANPPVPLIFLFLKTGGELNLLWQGEPGLILQSSDLLDDDWVEMPGATSPLLLNPGEPDPRKFFRLSQ